MQNGRYSSFGPMVNRTNSEQLSSSGVENDMHANFIIIQLIECKVMSSSKLSLRFQFSTSLTVLGFPMTEKNKIRFPIIMCHTVKYEVMEAILNLNVHKCSHIKKGERSDRIIDANKCFTLHKYTYIRQDHIGFEQNEQKPVLLCMRIFFILSI